MESTTPFGAEHARRLRIVEDAGFLPDGARGFFTIAEPAAESPVGEERRAGRGLWMFDRDGADVRRVGTTLPDLDTPAPSPDGRCLAVVAEVDGRRQICLVPIRTDQREHQETTVRTLTSLPQGVSGRPVWSPDGRSIAFTAPPVVRRDPTLPYLVDREPYRWDGLGILDDVVTDIYVVDVATGTVRRLTDDRAMNGDPRWSPDGRSLCYLASFCPDRVWDFLPDLYVLPVAGGSPRALITSWGGVFAAEWSTDGTRIVFVGCPDNGLFYPTQKLDLWTVEVAAGAVPPPAPAPGLEPEPGPECRTAGLTTGVGAFVLTDLPVVVQLTTHRLRVHGEVAYVRGQLGGDVVIYQVGLTGPESVALATRTDGSAYLVDADPRGELLYLATSFTAPPELMLGPRRITTLNDALNDSVVRPVVRRLEAIATDGLRTQAWALTPPGTGPWPTVLCVHGGPYSAFGNVFMIDFHLLVGAGFAVVFHNFRGSYGYGGDFSRRLAGGWGPAGALDHHAAVDAAIAAGIADPDRVGVCGLSYGGFAACWLVGTSDRFRAAVAENACTDWATFYGRADVDSVAVKELGGTPDEVPDAYRDGSPLTYARDCRTPLLFIVGEDDLRCPPGESEQYYRVLKANGVPTAMLRLPGSAHLGSANGPLTARAAQNTGLVDWFRRYLVSPT